MAAGVTSIYLQVVDDVISKVREEFLSFGAGENILNELQGLWEMKMMQCGAISANIERLPAPKNAAAVIPVHDLNVPYDGSLEEYETPTAEMLFPPTPLQTPLPQTVDNLYYQTPTPGDFAAADDINDVEMKAGRQSPFMPPSPWVNQRHQGVDVNVVYDEARVEVNRVASSQPSTQDFLMASSGKRKRDANVATFPSGARYIPQQDGSCDVPQVDGIIDGEEPPLNEDDDLDDLEEEDEEEVDTEHLILAQFDKVTRAKNKWKCTLKDGIMHLNSKDVLFNKASGEFEF